MLCTATKAAGVFCASYTRNVIEPTAVSFLRSSPQPLPRTRLQAQPWKKCSSVPRASMTTNLAIKREQQRERNERQQQCLIRSVNKFITLTAPSSNDGPVISLKVIPATRILQKGANQSTADADDLESANGNLDEEYIPPVELPQKSQLKASLGGAAQPYVKLIPKTLENTQLGHCNESVASPFSKTCLFDDVKRDFLPSSRATEAPFEDEVSLDWVCNREGLRKFSFRTLPISTYPYLPSCKQK